MTPRIFVTIDPRHREGMLPSLRNVLKRLRPDFVEHLRIDADVGDAAASAMHSPRQQQMRRLAAEGPPGLQPVAGNPHPGAPGALDAAWQPDTDHRRAI